MCADDPKQYYLSKYYRIQWGKKKTLLHFLVQLNAIMQCMLSSILSDRNKCNDDVVYVLHGLIVNDAVSKTNQIIILLWHYCTLINWQNLNQSTITLDIET